MGRPQCTAKATDRYKNVRLTVRPFVNLHLPMKTQIKTFVDEIRIQADGAPLGFCVRNSEGRPGLTCIFTNDGSASVLEAADI